MAKETCSYQFTHSFMYQPNRFLGTCPFTPLYWFGYNPVLAPSPPDKNCRIFLTESAAPWLPYTWHFQGPDLWNHGQMGLPRAQSNLPPDLFTRVRLTISALSPTYNWRWTRTRACQTYNLNHNSAWHLPPMKSYFLCHEWPRAQAKRVGKRWEGAGCFYGLRKKTNPNRFFSTTVQKLLILEYEHEKWRKRNQNTRKKRKEKGDDGCDQ